MAKHVAQAAWLDLPAVELPVLEKELARLVDLQLDTSVLHHPKLKATLILVRAEPNFDAPKNDAEKLLTAALQRLIRRLGCRGWFLQVFSGRGDFLSVTAFDAKGKTLWHDGSSTEEKEGQRLAKRLGIEIDPALIPYWRIYDALKPRPKPQQVFEMFGEPPLVPGPGWKVDAKWAAHRAQSDPLRPGLLAALAALKESSRGETIYGISFLIDGPKLELRANTEEALARDTAALWTKERFFRESPTARRLALRWQVRHWNFTLPLGDFPATSDSHEEVCDRLVTLLAAQKAIGPETVVGFGLSLADCEKGTPVAPLRKMKRDTLRTHLVEALAEAAPVVCLNLYVRCQNGRGPHWFGDASTFGQVVRQYLLEHLPDFAELMVHWLEKDFEGSKSLMDLFTQPEAAVLEGNEAVMAGLRRVIATNRLEQYEAL